MVLPECCLCFLPNSAMVLIQDRSGLERVTVCDKVYKPLGLQCLLLRKHRSVKIVVKRTGFPSYISLCSKALCFVLLQMLHLCLYGIAVIPFLPP